MLLHRPPPLGALTPSSKDSFLSTEASLLPNEEIEEDLPLPPGAVAVVFSALSSLFSHKWESSHTSGWSQ